MRATSTLTRKNTVHVAAFLALVLMSAIGGPSAYAEDQANACSNTSNAARRACKHEAEDDYWIAVGNCNNLLDSQEVQTCKKAARGELKSARGDCAEQFEAREQVCAGLGQAPYHPIINPANFLSPAQIAANPNPYYPLIPGSTYVYHAKDEIINLTVTHNTKEILGVTTIVVRDTVTTLAGELVEDTNDWYTQDIYGNVWYFGEIARNFEDGELVDVEGSWKAGVDSAQPGIIMKAMPQIGDLYRQEFALGNAEDMGEVLSVTGTATVPAASCNGTCVITKDFTPISPGAVEHKYYAPGVGFVLEIKPETGERLELVEFSTP